MRSCLGVLPRRFVRRRKPISTNTYFSMSSWKSTVKCIVLSRITKMKTFLRVTCRVPLKNSRSPPLRLTRIFYRASIVFSLARRFNQRKDQILSASAIQLITSTHSVDILRKAGKRERRALSKREPEANVKTAVG